MSWLNVHAFLGCLALIGLAWLTSSNRKKVSYRIPLVGLLILLAIGAVVFTWPGFSRVMIILNSAVIAMVNASGEGARFLFGPLAAGPGEPGSLGLIIAFQVLPAVVFFSVITSLLYYFKILPLVTRWTARLVHRGFRLSGAEALATASNLFVGIESSLVVRPYLSKMTRSELMMILTAGLATIASTVLAFYVSLLKDVFPLIAAHLISASVLSIPAAVLCAKVLVPETETPETLGTVPPGDEMVESRHWMGSIIHGAMEGVRLAVGIGALLIGLLGLVKLVDIILGKLTGSFMAEPMYLADFLRWVAYPLVYCLGIPAGDLSEAARLLGERWILTEVVSYQHLAEFMKSGQISPRTLVVMSYALCGFTHVPSVAIFVGGISALAPERRDDLARLSWRALWAATLATLLTGAVAGVFYHGQASLIEG